MRELQFFSFKAALVSTAVTGIMWLFPTTAWAGHWEVSYRATGVGVANGHAAPWTPVQVTQFSDVRSAPGVPNNTYANSSGSVTAFLTWVADIDGELPPKKIFAREFANVSAHAWCPAHGSEVSLDNGFKDPVQAISDSFINKYFKSEGAHLTVVDNNSRAIEVRVPTRHFEASGVNLCPNAAGGARTDFNYRVEVIKFELRAKRKGTAIFGSQVSVAAGAKVPSEHFADLLVSTTPPLNDVPVNVYAAVGSGGADIGPTITLNRPTTDATGKITGTFRSGDLTQVASLELDTGQMAKLTVDQKWSDPTNPDVWEFPATLKYDIATPVIFKPKFKDGEQWIPITNHEMLFHITKIKYLTWDFEAEDYKLETSTDPSVIAYVADFSPVTPVADTGGGTYQANLTVKKTELILKEVYFDAEDQGVFSPW